MPNLGEVVKLKYNNKYKTLLLQNIVKSNHPVLILEVLLNNKIRICSLSSRMSRVTKSYPSNIALKDWKRAGLNKPTYADVSTTGIIDDSNIFKTYGKLSATDIKAVITAYNNTTQRQVIEAYKVYNSGEPEYLDYFVDKEGNINYVEI